MDNECIFKKIKDELLELGIKESQIYSDSKIIDNLGFDSLDVINFTMLLEDIFSISIPDSDIEKLDTVGKIVGYIQGKKK